MILAWQHCNLPTAIVLAAAADGMSAHREREDMIVLSGDLLASLARLEGVPSAVAASRDSVDAVLRDRGLRAVAADTSAQALVAAARANAALAAGDDDGPATDSSTLEGATVRLYTEIVDVSRLIRVAPGQAIARAHAVFGRGILADDQLGRARDDPDVAGRMASVNQLLTAATSASVIVVAGIAHAELVSCRPFTAGSGVVARAVEHMILIDGGIDSPAVTIPEAGHGMVADDTAGPAQVNGYREALENYRSGTADGARRWLLHVADAVARGAELSPLGSST